jgi:hypothetical protein
MPAPLLLTARVSGMDHSAPTLCFVDFTLSDEAAFERLVRACDALRQAKAGELTIEEGDWLPYFSDSDLSAFWWPDEAESKTWNAFWFATPVPIRHSADMPSPPWDFDSMIDAVLGAEYALLGVRRLDTQRGKLEFDPHAWPYGGASALRALVRCFGHTIIGFEDGTGFTAGDPEPPRWRPDMEVPR